MKTKLTIVAVYLSLLFNIYGPSYNADTDIEPYDIVQDLNVF